MISKVISFTVILPKIFWTAGAYNEIDKQFYWFELSKKILREGPVFNYTNWVEEGPQKEKLVGDECVIVNCSVTPCRWDIKHYKEKFGISCESRLSDGFRFPKNISRFSKFTQYNRSLGHSANRNLYFIIYLILSCISEI